MKNRSKSKKSKIKKGLKYFLLILLLFVVYLLFNTFNFKSKQLVFELIKPIEIPSSSVANFSKSIQIKTISPENSVDFDSTAFYNYVTYLEKTYPLVDSILEKKTFNTFSFLYKWEGSDQTLKPIVLIAHLDVVPALENNLKDWKEKPFGGKIIDGIIWGRGTLDDKLAVNGIMEAMELLLQENYKPRRTIYFSLGHDEEIGGLKGAKVIAEYLESQNVKAEFVLDEGMAITQKLMPGFDKDLAMIGVAEKGFVTLELAIKIEGGHSSMPKKETAIDVMSSAVSRLKNNPFPSRLSPPLRDFMRYVGPEMDFTKKIVFSNTAVFGGIIKGIYEGSSSGNAMIRTTTSPTIFNSGIKENVIPQIAEASVNFRILPGDKIADVIKHVKQTIADERITINQKDFSSEPSSSSGVNTFGFHAINKTIVQIYPEVAVAPSLVVGGTDSRFFENVSDNIYRFIPFYIHEDNIKSYHGINEKISVKEYENAIRFYVQLIRNGQDKGNK